MAQMDDVVPLAKLTRPRLSSTVARERLFQWMDEARTQPVLWVCAPPGAGKTTLVSSYLEARSLLYLWYQCDAGDGDIATWFHYLDIAALQLAPRHTTLLPRLTPDHLARLDLFACRLFARFALPSAHKRATDVDSGRAGAAALVLDNYQDVPLDSPLHALLAEALTQMPRGVNVIVVSRTEPPAAYARLRANGAIAWLDYESLKLTHAETAAIVKQRARTHSHDDVTLAHIEKFYAVTQGWAAGLTLLLERKGASLDHLANARPPTYAPPQVVFDYFAGEVFQRLNSAQQNIILQAATLPDMEAGAVRDLTTDERAADVLADLAQCNYFTQVLEHVDQQAPAPNKGTDAHSCPTPTYRFHPLLRAFLLNQARHEFSDEFLNDLRRRAACILEKRGNIEDAIDLLLQASAWESATRLIVAHAPKAAMHGRLQIIGMWMHRLPESYTKGSPWLLYWLSECRFASDPVAARAYAERAYTLFDMADDAAGLYRAWATIVVSYLKESVDFTALDQSFEALHALQRRHPLMPSAEIEAIVVCAVFSAIAWRADKVDLNYWRDRATRIIYSGSPPNSQRILLCVHLTIDAVCAARMGEADALVNILRALVESPQAAPVQRIVAYNVLGIVAYQRGAAEEWMAAIKAAKAISSQHAIRHTDSAVLHTAVYGALMTNNVRAAQGFLHDMGHTTGDDRSASDMAVYQHCTAMVALHHGDLAAAEEHSRRSLDIVVGNRSILSRIFCHIGMAQILFANSDTTAAFEHLRLAEQIATRMGFRIFEYACALSEAQFTLEIGHTTQGLDHLRRALAMSRHAEGRSYPFWPRPVLVKLLSTALRHDIEVEHVQSLIRRLNLVVESSCAPPIDIEHWPWSIKIYTLDRFTVLLRDGRPLSFTGKAQKRPLELLKALIAHGGRKVSVRMLIDALWGDVDGDAGQGALDSTLHRLRKLLGDERALVLQDGCLTLSAHCVWVDLWALHRMLSEFDEAVPSGDGAYLENLINKVFALYRAPFLGDIDTPWAASMRERLRSRFLQHILQVGDYYENTQQWRNAVRLYERALRIDLLAEDLCQRVMIAYRHLDRRADALLAYQRCERALTASLGILPSREIRSLRDSLRAEQ